jgi:beta-1,4-mannosyl-glycoprotein beta-1,4-N-acetylglucosaminyltransferase
MIVDTFLFNDEFEMLDIRLALTEKYVDKWIILEGNKTWSWKPKTFNLKENIDRYSKYGDRIEVISLDIPKSVTLPNVPKHWIIENFSRMSLQQGIDRLDTEDIIIHSDLDENLDPGLVPDIIKLMDDKDKPVACKMHMFFYAFNLQAYRGWKGSMVARKRMFENPQRLYRGKNHKRKDRSHAVHYPETAGWHWSWVGTDDRIRNKVKSCVETKHWDADKTINNFKELKTEIAINHKCRTRKVDFDYPKEVMDIIGSSPYWV